MRVRTRLSPKCVNGTGGTGFIGNSNELKLYSLMGYCFSDVLSFLFRGWKRNNWISLIHYSIQFFSELFIIPFSILLDIHYSFSSSSSNFSYIDDAIRLINFVFKISQSHTVRAKDSLKCLPWK